MYICARGCICKSHMYIIFCDSAMKAPAGPEKAPRPPLHSTFRSRPCRDPQLRRTQKAQPRRGTKSHCIYRGHLGEYNVPSTTPPRAAKWRTTPLSKNSTLPRTLRSCNLKPFNELTRTLGSSGASNAEVPENSTI